MPYIPKAYRKPIDEGVITPRTAGQLNYKITSIIKDFLGSNATYGEYNEVIGVLECAKIELYRRRVALYEDSKCNENGDVY